MNIGVLASGGGTNFQSIIDSCESGYIPESQLVVAISNKEDAFALQRAEKHGIDSIYLEPPDGMKIYKKGMAIEEIMNDPFRKAYDRKIAIKLSIKKVDVVCLAGYMLFVTPELLDKYDLINIHPALLPSFKGMHGVNDAWNYGTKVIGCTTHFVDDKEDHGPIILQATTPVFPNSTPQILAERNLKREHVIYPESIRLYQQGLLKVNGRSVEITWDKRHFEFHRKVFSLWSSEINDYNNSRQ